ncbi:hypothetical protein [Sphingomicrobium nitratireducens]|uniref:hypothetical protein n=1 Tax=Sphingomicrobium nitratireducens TaxID=2964666 RepID=UPI00223F87AA|nr:hypothetical protein [Sphingomicrobium nitratireducens]
METLSARKAGMLGVVAIIYITQQIGNVGRELDTPRLIGWAVLSVLILGVLLTNGYWLMPKAVRNVLDDELTQSHRARSIRIALTVAMLSGFAFYATAPGLDWGIREAVHALVSLGLGAGLISLAVQEWRSTRNG